MAAHRYWRATAFEAYGAGDLELSEFHLLAGGVRVDEPATLTANVAPDVFGAVANFEDDVLATAARWSAPLVKGLALTWDFGGATADVDDIRLSGDSESRFPLIVKIQWSDNATTWVDQVGYSGVKWPGLLTKTESSSGGGSGVTGLNLSLDGANGGTSFPDSTGALWTPSGGVVTSTSQSKSGGASALFNGSSRLSSPTAFNFGGGDYTVQGWIFLNAISSEYGCFFDNRDGGSQGNAIYTLNGQIFLTSHNAGLSPGGSKLLTAGVWTHWAVSLVGSTFYAHLGGSNIWTAADSRTPVGSAVIYLGATLINGQGFTGYLEDVTITGGIGLYTGDFVPPSSPSIGVSSIHKNKVMGRVAAHESVSVGVGPIITYGTQKIALPDYLSIESGSVKDQITGVLGDGIGRVKGTVKTKGSPNQPVHRKVRLIRERDGVVIREAWSNAASGEYDFQYVDEAQSYTVVSYDHLHNYRAVIADNIVPELMP